MVGGTTSGYSLIGNRTIAIRPMMKMMIESTPAKMGRRMKKWEKFIGPLVLVAPGLAPRNSGSWSARHRLLGGDGHARTHALQTVDHDHLLRLEPGADDAFAVDDRTQFHRPVRHGVGGSESQDKLLRLVRANGPFIDKQDRMTLAERHSD